MHVCYTMHVDVRGQLYENHVSPHVSVGSGAELGLLGLYMKFFTHWAISRLWGLWPNWSFEFIILAKLGGGGAIRSRLQAACPGIMFFFLWSYFLMCVSVLVDCMSVHNMYAWCLRRLEGGITSPELVLMNCCEPLCGCQESSSGPLKGNKFSYLLSHLSSLLGLYLIRVSTAFPCPALWCKPSYSARPCPPALTDISNKLWAVFLCQVALSHFLMMWKLL